MARTPCSMLTSSSHVRRSCDHDPCRGHRFAPGRYPHPAGEHVIAFLLDAIKMREYSTRAFPTHRADRGGSMAMPVSAKAYSARLRSISYAISAWNSGVARRVQDQRRTAGGQPGAGRPARSRSSSTSRRKLVSWKASPSARAGFFAAGSRGSSTGSIISPMTAADPSM